MNLLMNVASSECSDVKWGCEVEDRGALHLVAQDWEVWINVASSECSDVKRGCET